MNGLMIVFYSLLGCISTVLAPEKVACYNGTEENRPFRRAEFSGTC
jgi:hypothetical protein